MSEVNRSPESDDTTTLSRRRFLKGSLAAAAAASASFALPHGSSEAATARANPLDAPPKPPRGKGDNILIILCDQMRFPPFYESDTTKQFRDDHLGFQKTLRSNGLDFQRHYVASAACVPSRASIVTGHYPSLHGTSQTVGSAKDVFEADTFWLDPNSVPTFGNYFRAAGYQTFWVGKWHASAAEMFIPGTHEQMLTFDSETGVRDPDKEALYKAANRLGPFGFAGWIGPEPHGSLATNSGSSVEPPAVGRDVGFADQGVELIQELDRHPNSAPWLAVCSFTNPHDIACWGLIDHFPQSGFYFEIDNNVVPAADLLFTSDFYATLGDTLSTKPTCQNSYRNSYHIWQQPILAPGQYHRFYHQLHKNVDEQMARVMDALLNSKFKDNTIVIFTSDHGEMLSAHGDMHQKFYQAYEETTRVPLIIWSPKIFPAPRTVDTLTSHADLAPTLLGLAGIDPEPIRQMLALNHSDAVPFVGRNLSPLILGEIPPESVNDPVYFMTDDDVSRGLSMDKRLGFGIDYHPVDEPNSVETVIARLDDGHLWKYSRYFDNTQYWTNPDTPPGTLGYDVLQVQTSPDPPPDAPTAEVTFDVTVKGTPRPDEFEMYDLDEDPLELINRYGDPAYLDQQTMLAQLLQEQREQKRLTPCSGVVPGQGCNRSEGCDQQCGV